MPTENWSEAANQQDCRAPRSTVDWTPENATLQYIPVLLIKNLMSNYSRNPKYMWLSSVCSLGDIGAFASAKSGHRRSSARHFLLMAFTSALALAGLMSASASAQVQPQSCPVQFGFSPNRGGMDLVIGLIDAAQRGQMIEVAAYEFTSKRMARSLHAALRRGATLHIAVDAKVNVAKPYSVAYQFVGVAGAEVRYEDHWPIFHEKVTMVRALNAVEEGSMNYTDSGDTRNRENANLLTQCPSAVHAYGADFDDLWAQGTPMQ